MAGLFTSAVKHFLNLRRFLFQRQSLPPFLFSLFQKHYGLRIMSKPFSPWLAFLRFTHFLSRCRRYDSPLMGFAYFPTMLLRMRSMNHRMTRTAQRCQIIKTVVQKIMVEMVHYYTTFAKYIFLSTALASKVVPLQRLLPHTIKSLYTVPLCHIAFSFWGLIKPAGLDTQLLPMTFPKTLLYYLSHLQPLRKYNHHIISLLLESYNG